MTEKSIHKKLPILRQFIYEVKVLFTITENKIDKIIIFNLSGNLNFSNALKAEKRFLEGMETKPIAICINCTDLQTIDSSGLGTFISLSKKLSKTNINLAICELNDNISNLFDFSKLSHFFRIMSMDQFKDDYL